MLFAHKTRRIKSVERKNSVLDPAAHIVRPNAATGARWIQNSRKRVNFL